MLRFLKVILLLVIVLGILAGVGLYVAARPGWVRERIRDILAQELANRTGREVQVGAVEGNLLTGIIINDLAIAEQQGLSEGVVLGAGQVRIKYNLLAVLRGQVAAAASVQQIDLYQVYVKVVRDETGQINLTRIFPPAEVPVPPEKRFRGTVIVHSGVIDLEDQALIANQAESLALRLTAVEGQVAVNPYGPVVVTVQAKSGRFGSVKLRAQADTENRVFCIDGSVIGLDGPWWFDIFARSDEFRLTQGQVDGSFSFWSLPGASGANSVGYFAAVTISKGQAAISRLSPSEVTFAGEMYVTPEGIDIHRLDAQWAGAQVGCTGTIFDFSALAVDLDISIGGVDRRHLASLLPADVRTSLPDITGLRSVAAQVEAVGPWPHVAVHVIGESMLPLQVQSGMQVTVDDLSFEGWMPDITEPAVLVEVGAGKVQPAAIDIPRLIPTSSSPPAPTQTLKVSSLEDMRVSLLYAGQIPVAETWVAIDKVTLGELSVDNVTAAVQVVGSTVRIEGLQAQALGGSITGHGLIQDAFAEDRTIHLDGLAQGLDLTHLHALDLDLPADLAGRANLLFAGRIDRGNPQITARLHARDLRVNGLEAEDIVGLVEIEDGAISFPLLAVTDPKGLVWARGMIDTTGQWTAKVAAAELDVGAIGQQLGQAGMGGIGYAAGEIGGGPDGPRGQVEAVVFEPGYEQYQGDLVLSRIVGNADQVRVEELWVARDTAIIRGQGQLTHLDLEAKNANVAGEVKIVGFRVQDVGELTGQPLPAAGNVEGQIVLSGTLRRPVAEGQLHLDYGSYGGYSVDTASLSFGLAEDTLQLHHVRIRAGDAIVEVEGKIWSIYDQAQYEGQLSASGIYLQDITPLQQMGLEVAGEVKIPVAHIKSGPRGMEGEGRLVAAHITIAGEPITNIDTLVTIGDNQLQLQRTSLQAAGGQVEAAATYNWQEQYLSANVDIDSVDIQRLLWLAVPIAGAVPEAHNGTSKQIQQQLRSLSLRTQGRLSLSTQLEGSPADLGATVQLAVAGARWDGKWLPQMKGRFNLNLVAGQVVSLTDIDMEMAEAPRGYGLLILTGDIEPGGELSLVADASSFDLALWQSWMPPQLRIGGTMGLTVVAEGPTNSPRLKGSVDILNANFQGVRFDLVSVPIVNVTEEQIDIDTLILKRGQQQIVMDGYLPFTWKPLGIPVDEQMKFVARVKQTDLSFFPPVIAEFIQGAKEGKGGAEHSAWADMKAQGEVNSEVSLTGSIAQPVLQGYLRIADGELSGPSWKYPIKDIDLDIQLVREEGQNILQVRQAQAHWDNTALMVDGQISIVTATNLLKNTFDISLRVEAPQQRLWPGTAITELAGQVDLITQADGTHLLAVSQLGGQLGQGSVYLSGTSKLTQLALHALANNASDFRLEFSQAEVGYADMFKGVVAGLITARNPQPGAPLHIAGGLTVHHARLGPPTGGGVGAPGWRGLSADFPNPTFDVAIAIGTRVALSSPGINAPLQPTAKAVLISGTPQRPVITGQIEVQKGKTSVPGGAVSVTGLGVKYRVGPSPTSYEIPAELELSGQVWGSAERIISSATVGGQTVGPIHIYIDIAGSLPDQITVRTRSEPLLSEEQIYAMLGTEPFGQLVGTQEAANIRGIVSKQFMGLLAAGFRAKIFEPIEEQLRRTLGLSEFSVHFAFDQPLEVHIGKYVLEDFLVSYQHTIVAETTDKWDLSLSYRLPRRLHVSYSTNESGEAQVRIGRTYAF